MVLATGQHSCDQIAIRRDAIVISGDDVTEAFTPGRRGDERNSCLRERPICPPHRNDFNVEFDGAGSTRPVILGAIGLLSALAPYHPTGSELLESLHKCRSATVETAPPEQKLHDFERIVACSPVQSSGILRKRWSINAQIRPIVSIAPVPEPHPIRCAVWTSGEAQILIHLV